MEIKIQEIINKPKKYFLNLSDKIFFKFKTINIKNSKKNAAKETLEKEKKTPKTSKKAARE